jgi:membrane protease YdiL (CAAX protease family)
MLAALVFPTIIGLLAYGSAWVLGLAQFVEPTGAMAELGRSLIGAEASSAIVVFMATLLVASTYGTLFGVITATGEEIGWRGYMLTRLIDAGVPHPLLVSGLLWAIWHVPLILAGSYAAGPFVLLSAASFIVGVSAVGYIIGRLRLETGSLWPAIVLHAAWNSIIQGGFDPASRGESATLWTGESGLLVSLCLLVAALLLARRPWAMLRQPTPHPRTQRAEAAEHAERA